MEPSVLDLYGFWIREIPYSMLKSWVGSSSGHSVLLVRCRLGGLAQGVFIPVYYISISRS